MKILIVSDYYSPGNSRLLQIYGQRLSNRNHQVGLLAGTDRPTDNARELREANVQPFLYNDPPNQNAATKLLTRLSSPLNQYENFCSTVGDPDVVIFNQPLTALPILLRYDSQITVYVHHGPWAQEWSVHHPERVNWIGRLISKPHRLTQKAIRHYVEGWILDRVNRIVVLSQYMKRKVETNHPGLSTPAPTIVPGGVDPERFNPDNRRRDREELGWSNQTVLFTLRRLVHRMGVDRLIESYGRLASTYFNGKLRLVVGGTGPERENLEERANRIEDATVKFVGFVEDSELPRYYRAADLFVLPTRRLEGFGLVTLEALASGTPVVATRTGGTEEILSDFDRGLFLPDYTPEKWSKHLKEILNSDRMTPEFRKQCRNFILANYTWSRAIDQLENFVTELYRGR